MSILEKYSKVNFPEGRLPTMEECVAVIQNPDSAPWWIRKYLELQPEFEQNPLSILELLK